MDLDIELSLVLPVYNESAVLRGVVEECLAHKGDGWAITELVIIENGSTDGSAAQADEISRQFPAVRVIHLPRADYGAALRRGLSEARRDFIAHFSVDFIDWDFLHQAMALLISGRAQLVVGSKYITESRDQRALLRRLPGLAFSKLTSVLLQCPISDTHGIKAMGRKSCQPLADACRLEGALFDHEFVLSALDSGLAILEVPVSLKEIRPSRRPVSSLILQAIRDLGRLTVARALKGKALRR